MKKYKVLHIMNGADMGGIPSVILNYYRNIDRSQFQFDFVIPQGKFGPNGPELEKLGGTFYELPPKGKHPFAFIKELSRLIKRNNYDVVHAHHHSSSYLPLFVALFCGVKCRVAQCHSYMIGESLLTKIKRFIGIVLNNMSSNLRFACTDEAASHLFGKWFKSLFPIIILPNGVEPEKFSFSEESRLIARKELNIDHKTLVFGIVARMTPEKNHKFLIYVLAETLRIKKDVKLLLVGDGPQRKELCELASRMGVVDNVIFAGKRPDLVNMLGAMDVFVLPSFYEGSPVSAVEAASNGLPIVLSSRITKDIQFLSNVAYIDINNNTYKKWAVKIIDFADRGRNNCAISIIKENGFDVRTISKLLVESYLKIIKNDK